MIAALQSVKPRFKRKHFGVPDRMVLPSISCGTNPPVQGDSTLPAVRKGLPSEKTDRAVSAGLILIATGVVRTDPCAS